MIIVEGINDFNISEICDFLLNVPSISSLDENIIKNAVIAKEDNEIIGSISFEEYDKSGLIRYFVFKRKLDNTILEEMLAKLISNALASKLERLVSVADSLPTLNLFKSLDFSNVEGPIFIDEEKIENTNFKNSSILMRVL